MESLASLIYESPEMKVAQKIECKIGPKIFVVKCFSCVVIKSERTHHVDELRVVFFLGKCIKHVMECSTTGETSLKRVNDQFR